MTSKKSTGLVLGLNWGYIFIAQSI